MQLNQIIMYMIIALIFSKSNPKVGAHYSWVKQKYDPIIHDSKIYKTFTYILYPKF